jgi:tetratricopeptide (TPR) repeat protein
VRIARPQPLGAFPLPAGLLLITGEGSDPVRRTLLDGRLPTRWPESLDGARLAYTGHIEAAIRYFAASSGAVAAYNLFVLDPGRTTPEAVAAGLGAPWRPLVDHVAYVEGMRGEPASSGGADGEVAALVATGQAAAALDRGDLSAALDALRTALSLARAAHPAFAGVVAAELAARTGDAALAEEAVVRLTATDLADSLAEALALRAHLAHRRAVEGRGPLSDAIVAYSQAARRIDEATHPRISAQVHAGLGAAYLAGASGPADGLRAGIAIQSLRTAVRLLRPPDDAAAWQSATLTLASALVCAPSTHARDHLREAVDLYEAVIRVRDAATDPAGRARALAGQGSALGHLGEWADAAARLNEAAVLFAQTGDTQAEAAARNAASRAVSRGEPQVSGEGLAEAQAAIVGGDHAVDEHGEG